MQRVAIFVDVQNIYYTVKQAFNGHFNYSAFWASVTSDRQVVKAIAYAIDKNDLKQQQFQDILRKIGFEVKLKPYISRSDGSSKGDWDVGITIDMLEYAPLAEVVILASGDGDFDLLLERINQYPGVETHVYGVASLTAQALIKAASKFVAIDKELLIV